MDLARLLIAQEGLEKPFAALCRHQTAGRGRGGSVWSQGQVESDKNKIESQLSELSSLEARDSLAQGVRLAEVFGPCTFVVPGHLLKIPLSWVSLAVGCAISDALWRARSRIGNRLEFSKHLPTETLLEARLKWPNDVWAWPSSREGRASSMSAKKVAGILCESSFRADALQFVSIGLGMNLLVPPAEVPHAGSVMELWGVDRSSLNTKLQQTINEIVAEEIERELLDYLLTERTAEQLMHLTLERSLPLGTPLSVNKGAQTGKFAGLSAEGGLLLEGHSEAIFAADVSFPEPFARLCLDFGNSHIHWRSESGDRVQSGSVDWSLLDKKTLALPDHFLKSEFAQTILKSLRAATRIELVWSAVASAVQSKKIVQNLESLLVEHSEQRREISLVPIQADVVLRAAGLESDYASDQMGVDRALQCWAASRLAQDSQHNVAVLSVGTAFTGVVVGPQPKLLESFILPGPEMSLRTLHEKTARLPFVSLPNEFSEVCNASQFSTPVSMLRGLVLQWQGIIRQLALQNSVERFILTGGGATACFEVFEKDIQNLMTVEPNFVLKTMSEYAATQKNSRFNLSQDVDENEEGLPEKVLQSMLRARLSKRRSQRVALDKKHFRRLGGRLEHLGVGLRLDRHLGEKFKFHNRDVWQQRIDIGEVLIEQNSPKNHTTDEAPANLISAKPTYVLKQGDQIWLFHPPEYEPDMMTNIEVVYDDGDAAVFCKPGNLVVHAAGLYGKNTFIEIAKKMGYANAAPVHRIDRETSGLLVCARSTPLRRDLSLSFRDSSVKKMYLAVTKGQRSLPREFRVALPIGPAINSRIRLKLWHNPHEGLDALTHCVRLSQWEDYSLFACMPQTGRTNQIRVHLAAIGHWIVGDKMYHPDEEAFLQFYEEGYIPVVAEKVLLPRHWLHNTGIQFFSRPDSALGREPVIAPLTDDLLTHAPTLELLRAAQLPTTPAEQKAALSHLFRKVLAIDFASTPALNPVDE